MTRIASLRNSAFRWPVVSRNPSGLHHRGPLQHIRREDRAENLVHVIVGPPIDVGSLLERELRQHGHSPMGLTERRKAEP